MKREAKAYFSASNGVAEHGSSTNDMFVLDLNKKVDGNSSAKGTLRRGSAETGDENVFEEADAPCVLAE